ncbi:MAG: nuclear transport factor 2 family protein [Ruminococcus sp.]|nr:nuclear transport factor 2 family protein [Ruminococcus sp.]
MTTKETIFELYKNMYTAMINKDETALNDILADNFELIHMTGMRQTKQAFIKAVLNGTLNYFSAIHEESPVTVNGNNAEIIGHSKVNATVFGGGRHTWRLEQVISMQKIGGEWKITHSTAGTY